ncbi:MAG: isoprenyl transferase [Bacteroidota bacterium]
MDLDQLKSQIELTKLPKHIAIIMDGNGRWAKQFGRLRIFGHQNGVKAVRETTEAAAELGVKYLTLYAFSTENWGRPQAEVNALMTLLVNTIKREIKTLMENDIRLEAIGDIENLPGKCYRELIDAIDETKGNKRMTLVLALNYSAKWEILNAVRDLADQTKKGELDPQDIDADHFERSLSTSGMPDPELLIRTSGETRISNFLLWQIAYAELYFTPVFWPDFRKAHFYQAIIDYQKRERRFGKTSDQLTS